MSSIGLLLDIATEALSAARSGVDITGHNIANVNTPGYSRQSPVYEAEEPILYSGLYFGTGVETSAIVRTSDQFIENWLMQQNSNMVSSEAMEQYLRVLEGIFNESSETTISAMMAGFWNGWHDIMTDPSGMSQRIALYEHSILLSEQFNAFFSDLIQIDNDLSNVLTAGIEQINRITGEIAALNVEIVGIETSNNANDLRDKRTLLVNELAEYLDVKSFEQDNGSLTIITARGCNLVAGSDNYELELGGDNSDRVLWQSSGSVTVDITDYITKGKMGGWLELRDEVVAKYQLDLDALAKEFIWMVNRQHSQGVGLQLFEPGSTVTGTSVTTTDLGDLEFGDEIQYIADGVTLWIEDRTDPANPVMNSVSLDLSGLTGSSSLSDLATAINTQIAAAGYTGVTADGSGTAISFTAGSDYAFGFSDDESGIVAALGVNTFFDGVGAGSIAVNAVLNDKHYIAAAQIDSSGNYAVGDNSNARAIADLQYTSTEISQWTCDRIDGNTEGSVTTTIEGYYHTLVSSIGVISESATRSRTFTEAMVNKLTEVRDSISAVSLDEEMANLIKFQHAYSAAAKLIGVADEMLDTLMSVK